MQLNIKRVRKAAEDEYDPADYLPVSENSTDDMYSQLRAFIDSVENTYLSALLKKLFAEDEAFVKAFEGHSAAKTVHHGFIGGLMEHTLGVTRLCLLYTSLNLETAQDSTYTGNQFLGIKGFDHIVICTQFKSENLVKGFAFC